MQASPKRLIFCGAAGAALAWSVAASAQPPTPEATYAYEQTRPNRPLLVTGSSLLIGSYATSAIIGMANDREADERLAIPVVGPWLNLADRDCNVQPCDNENWSKAALITSGVLQGVGLVGVVSSFFVPEERFRLWGGGGRARVASTPVLRLVPAPAAVGRGGTGFALVGTFLPRRRGRHGRGDVGPIASPLDLVCGGAEHEPERPAGPSGRARPVSA